jgi:hypothetical protein
MLGYSAFGGELLLHELKASGGSREGAAARCVRSAASSYPAHMQRAWGVQSYPMLCGGDGCSGATLVPLPTPSTSACSPEELRAQGNAVLVQQTTRGDVIGQFLFIPSLAPHEQEQEQEHAPSAPVQLRAMLGMRSHCPPSDAGTNFAEPRLGLARIKTRAGRGLEGLLTAEGRSINAPLDCRGPTLCPLGSSAYLPSVPEDSLRRFDVLLLKPSHLRRDWPQLQREPMYAMVRRAVPPLLSVQASELLRQLHGLEDFVSAERRTLWEIAHFVCLRSQQQLSCYDLRRHLLSAGRYREWLLPGRAHLSAIQLRMHYGDGLAVSVKASQDGGEQYQEPERYGCSCPLDYSLLLQGLETYACTKRDCWMPHCLAYSALDKMTDGFRRSQSQAIGAGEVTGSGISADLIELLGMEWSML